MKCKLTLAIASLLLTISSAAAHADTITFTLSNPVQVVSGAATSVTYAATVSADPGNDAAVFLNGDNFTLDSPLTMDDSDFAGFPLFLDAGDSFSDDLFTLDLPAGTPSGVYLGTFTLQGGSDNAGTDTLGTVNFSVIVTPEPSTFTLAFSGLGGLVCVTRRRRQR